MVEIHVFDGDANAHQGKIAEILNVHSREAGHPWAPEAVNLYATVDAAPAGGLAGQLLYGWLWVMLLAVEPAFRGRGVGSGLLAEAETIARAKGAIGVNVDTFGFQAADFYLGLGYQEVSRLEGPTPEEDRIFFVKRL